MTYALITLLVLVGGIAAYAATRPDSFRLERSIVIAAPPDKILPLIADFHRWAEWSPYETIDPTMTRTFGGEPRGVGATYAWSGTGKAGAGRMEITGQTAESVTIKLDFSKPFEAHNIAEFTAKPEAGGTHVTWAMHGPSPFITKLITIVVSMDRLVGKDFESGLANMKQVAER